MITKLKHYTWKYSNRKIALLKEGRLVGDEYVLNKVEFLSLARFIIRALDRMRVEENVRLRNELVDLKEKYRASIKNQKALSKQIKKESRHSVGNPSKNSSGEQV
jgi:hypothetical protein